MAKSWKEIVALPAYQDLPAEKQERVRQAYFDEVVAPSLSFSDLADARSAFDEATAPPPPPKQNASFAGDMVDLTKRGFLNSVGGLLDFAGADTGAQYFYDQGEQQRATMTPETQAALEQPLFDDAGDYYLGKGASNPRAWLAQGIETLGGSALPIPGGFLAKAALRPLLGLGKAAQAVKGGLVAEGVGARAAARPERELAPDWRDTAALVGGYGGMEGAVSAGLTEQQVREQVLAKPQADLEATPEYWQAMQEAGGDPAAARTLMAETLGKEAAWKTFGPTAVLGAGAGRYYDRLVGGAGSGSRLVNAGKGAVTEALEEAPQSLAETLATNSTLQAVDPGLELDQGAVANMLTGAAMGAAVGGVMGGVLPKGRVEERGALSRAANQGLDAADAGLPPAPPAPEVEVDPLAEGKVAEQAAKVRAAEGKAEGQALKNQVAAAKLAGETGADVGQGEGLGGPETDGEALSRYDQLMAEEAARTAGQAGQGGGQVAMPLGGEVSQGAVQGTAGDPNVMPSAREQADQARFQEQLRQATAGTGVAAGPDGSLPTTANPAADAIRQNHIALMRKGLAGGKLTKKQAAAPDWAYVREAVPLGAPMPTDAEILQLLNDFENGVPVPGAPGVAVDASPAPGVITDEEQHDVESLQDQGQGQAAAAPPAEVTAEPPSAWAAEAVTSLLSTPVVGSNRIQAKQNKNGEYFELVEDGIGRYQTSYSMSGIYNRYDPESGRRSDTVLNALGDFVDASSINRTARNADPEITAYQPRSQQEAAELARLVASTHDLELSDNDFKIVRYRIESIVKNGLARKPEVSQGVEDQAVETVKESLTVPEGGTALKIEDSASTDAPAAKLVTVVDGYGHVHRVMQADLDNPGREVLPTYTAEGKPKPGRGLHRENIAQDPQAVPEVRTRAQLQRDGYQTRRAVRTDAQEAALLSNGFRPVLATEGGGYRYEPVGVWAKPKQGEWAPDILEMRLAPTAIAATPTAIAATPTAIAATPTAIAATPTAIAATPTAIAATPTEDNAATPGPSGRMAMPRLRNWRFRSRAINSGRIVPNRVGAQFSPEELQELTAWAEDQGMRVFERKPTGFVVLRPSNTVEPLDLSPYGAQGAKDEARQRAREEEAARLKAEKEDLAAKAQRPAAQWVKATLPEAKLNNYHLDLTAAIIEGTRRPDNQVVPTHSLWLPALRRLDALTAGGAVDWPKLQRLYRETTEQGGPGEGVMPALAQEAHVEDTGEQAPVTAAETRRAVELSTASPEQVRAYVEARAAELKPQVHELLAAPPHGKGELVVFDVPGDGRFVIKATVERIDWFVKQIRAATQARRKPGRDRGPQGSSVREFLEELEQSNNPQDYENAIAIREARGIPKEGMDQILAHKRAAWQARDRYGNGKLKPVVGDAIEHPSGERAVMVKETRKFGQRGPDGIRVRFETQGPWATGEWTDGWFTAGQWRVVGDETLSGPTPGRTDAPEAGPLVYDPGTNRHNGGRLRRGDVLVDAQGRRYTLDRDSGFILQVQGLGDDNALAPSLMTVSVDPTDRERYHPLVATGENLYDKGFGKESAAAPEEGKPEAPASDSVGGATSPEAPQSTAAAKAATVETQSTQDEPTKTKPEASKEYRYALFNRPPWLGATPKGYLRVEPRPAVGQDHHETARHGVIVYDRPLTLKEMQDYELQPLADSAEREALAQAVADKLARYRDKVLAMADEGDFDQVRSSIANQFERFHPEKPSVGDFEAFVRQVVGKLREEGSARRKPDDAPTAIENFGAELPLRRRQLAAKLTEELADDDIANQPLSKTWPAAANAEIEDPFAAAVAVAARATIPNKPRGGLKLTLWVEQVKQLRTLAGYIVSGQYSREQFLEKRRRDFPRLRDWEAQVRLLEQLDREQWPRIAEVHEAPDARVHDDKEFKPAPYVTVKVDGQNRILRGSGEVVTHLDTIKALLGEPAATQKLKFEIRQPRSGALTAYINKVGDIERRRLLTFNSVAEASAALRERYADLVSAWEAVKERDNLTERDLRGAENRPRTGQDWRQGRDITTEEFAAQFGFRGGEFGKWMKQGRQAQERQAYLNSAYDALMDLANILGVPPKALSLNGTLGIAFGARGSGWASAHYEPHDLIINLTKPRGAGALAHEWFHALDNYFARARGGEQQFTGDQDAYRDQNFITYKPERMMVHKSGRVPAMRAQELTRRRALNPGSGFYAEDQWQLDPQHPEGVRQEVEARFAALVEALNASPMLTRARRLDGRKSGEGYWSRVIERAARAFENYVMARMLDQGYVNDFLTNVLPATEINKNNERYPYLFPDEIAPVAEAFDELFGTLQTREDEGGNVALFSRSTPGFYSPLAKGIAKAKQVAMPAGQWRNWLKANAANLGIKQAEIEAVGLDEYLTLRGTDKITREELTVYARDNGVNIEEVEKADSPSVGLRARQNQINERLDAILAQNGGTAQGLTGAAKTEFSQLEEEFYRIGREAIAKDMDRSLDTQYGSYTLQGGQNYRELLLTVPDPVQEQRKALFEQIRAIEEPYLARREDLPPALLHQRNALREQMMALKSRLRPEFTSGHWQEKNILAHVRFNERTDAEGKKVLFIEEIQSDWGQEGKKKGFGQIASVEDTLRHSGLMPEEWPRLTPERQMQLRRQVAAQGFNSGVPTAPFVTDTKAWTALALKRMIRYAAENGYDRVALVTGEQSAARYDLSKQVDLIAVSGVTDGAMLPPTGDRALNIMLADFAGDIDLVVDAAGVVTRSNKQPDLVGKPLDAVLGKEMAERILTGPRRADYAGDDLKIGGAGMKAYYDRIVPQVVNDLLKKLGGGKLSPMQLGQSFAQYRQKRKAVMRDGQLFVGGGIEYSEDMLRQDYEREGGGGRGDFTQPGFDIPQSMRDQVLNEGLPLFTKDGKAATGASPAAVRMAAERIRAKWANAPEVVVFTGMDDPQVDARVRAEYAKQTRERLAKNPKARADRVDAFYFRGRVYVNTETVRDYADLERALRHEALGHAGLRGLFGARLNGILDQVIAGQRATVAAKATDRGLDMAKLEKARTAAEEVLAELAETRPQLGVVRRAVALIRRWLREMGIKLELSDADLIAEYILPARGFIERGRGGQEGTTKGLVPAFMTQELPAMIRVDGIERPTTNSEGRPIHATAEGVRNFWKWFGDSKVVDKDGKPMVVYHGTNGERTVFRHYAEVLDEEAKRQHVTDPGLLESIAAAFDEPELHFFSESEDTAATYGSTVVAAYLRITDPVEAEDNFEAVDALVEDETLDGAKIAEDQTSGGRAGGPAWIVRSSQQIKSIRNSGAFSPDNPDIRFSLSPASGGSPLGPQGGQAFLNKVKTTLGRRWTQALGSREASPLMALTLQQLSEVGAKWLPGVELYNKLRRRMETRRNVMMEESGRLADAMESWARRHADEARQVWDLANDSTLAQVDPSDYQVLRIPLQLGPGREFLRNWAATPENVAELRRRAKVWRASSSTREREGAAYYDAAARKLAKAVRWETQRRAKLPALQQRWAALSAGKTHLDAQGQPFATEVASRAAQAKLPTKDGAVYLIETVPGGWAIQELGGQDLYIRMRDLYKKRSNEMMEALIERLHSLESLDEASKAALAARIRAEFENPLDEKGNPRIGPYFPLQRFGNFFLFARRYPEGKPRTFQMKNGQPFKDEQAAWAASSQRKELWDLSLKAVPGPEGKGFVLEERGEEGFWLFESVPERAQVAAELQGEGWTVVRQGLTQEASRALEGVSEGFMAEAVEKLKAQKSFEEADTLYQMYLQTLHQMSIRHRFQHRKGTKGYTADVLRSFAWNMTRQAHQISKLEGMPKLEKLLRDIEEGIKTGAQDQPNQDTTRQTALLIELKKRHEAIATPDGSALSNMLAALGFIFYLGVSPAAALVNLSQVPIMALPALAGRYGSWGAAAKALTTAFVDVARGFSPAVMKGFVTGRPLPSDAANLTAAERAAFVVWSESGVRDRTQVHNLAGIAEADSLLNGPTMNRVMAAVSSLFHAAEVLNRDTTLLAAYRLARAKGIEHETAVQQAEDATWEANFDYGNSNRARLMQGNVAKTLLMFKNYAQHVLYFLGRNLFLWAKGESPEVRKEARTKFTGMMGMTALFAGAAGLPIGGVFVMANALQALFGDDDEPWDAEIEFRNWLAATFPDPVAGMIDRGAVTRLSGLDFASRVSIRDLLWRAPDRDLDGKGLYQHVVEQVLGPIGGLAARPFTMADEVAEGNWARAAEAVVPKFARDLMQAGRFGVEGVTTRQGYPVMTAEELSSYELFWKAMGMQPDALAVRWDANAATKLYEGRIVNRRKALITAAALAMIHKDAATLKLAREEIAAFNKANPEVKIGLDTLTRSVRGRNTMRERAQFGVLVNPKLAGLRQTAGGFGYPERAEEEEDPEE